MVARALGRQPTALVRPPPAVYGECMDAHGSTTPVTIARLNGVDLAFQSFGDETAPAIVLVAGASSSMDWWDEAFCALLAAGDAASGPRRVVRYDLRDTGESETVALGEAAYTGDDLVDDLGALIEHLDAAPAHVVGLSMGGGLAMQLALRRPELLASIALMSTSPGGRTGQGDELPPPIPRLQAAFASMGAASGDDSDGSPVVVDPVAAIVDSERLFSGSIPVDEERVARIGRAVLARTSSPRSSENHWALESGPGAREDLESIAVPTLVVHGSEDPLFPLAHGERLAARIPGASLLVVPGMGHQNPPPPTWAQLVPALLAHTG
jgi:pimeloyl-ACP methyl ester carboxylesterase